MCCTLKCQQSSVTALRLAPPSGDSDKYVACALVRQALMLPHATATVALTRVSWQEDVSQGHWFLKYQRSLRTNPVIVNGNPTKSRRRFLTVHLQPPTPIAVQLTQQPSHQFLLHIEVQVLKYRFSFTLELVVTGFRNV